MTNYDLNVCNVLSFLKKQFIVNYPFDFVDIANYHALCSTRNCLMYFILYFIYVLRERSSIYRYFILR